MCLAKDSSVFIWSIKNEIIAFKVNSINDVEMYFSESNVALNYTGGLFTGVYGMWNLYVSAVMILYSPSHKDKTVSQHYETSSQVEDISMQSNLIQSDGQVVRTVSNTESVITTFANKISASWNGYLITIIFYWICNDLTLVQ